MTRAITLHQPHATLIALGVKRIETRSWPAPPAAIGERLLIHGATRQPRDPMGSAGLIGDFSLYQDNRGEAVYMLDRKFAHRPGYAGGYQLPIDLPLGAIVASATLTACVPMVVDERAESMPRADMLLIRADHLVETGSNRLSLYRTGWGVGMGHTDVSDQEPYGDFASGRWAWLLDDIQATTERCPACGGTAGMMEDPWGLMEEWVPCSTCDGAGVCEPIPAKGFQRIWRWTP